MSWLTSLPAEKPKVERLQTSERLRYQADTALNSLYQTENFRGLLSFLSSDCITRHFKGTLCMV